MKLFATLCDDAFQKPPAAAGKIQLLCRDGGDVADPIGGDIAEYERCAAQIETHLSHWISQLDLDTLPVVRDAT